MTGKPLVPRLTHGPRDQVLHTGLAELASVDPTRLLVTFASSDGEIREYTRQELVEETLRVAAALRRAGLAPLDRICIGLKNHPAFLPIWLGTVAAGLVVIPLNTALRGRSLQNIIMQSGPRYAFVGKTYLSTFEEVNDASIPIVGISDETYGRDARLGLDSIIDYIDFIDIDPLPIESCSASGEDVASVMFTSGTTGMPKGVIMTHKSILAVAETMTYVMGHRSGDVSFTPLPLFHASALITTFMCAAYSDGRSVILERFSASRYWQQVREHSANLGYMLGSMPALLWRQPESSDETIHDMRAAIAIPPPLSDFRAFERRFHLSIKGYYGSSDIGIPIATPAADRAPVGSCGREVPGWDCALVDDDLALVEDDVVGELIVRPHPGTAYPRGYLNNPDADESSWHDGWFRTGDFLRKVDGWYYYVDRKKDAIRRRGENISSFEVETAVVAFPGINEAAAFAVESEFGEDEVMVAVEVDDGGALDFRALVAECAKNLPSFAVPRYVRVVASLPRTENGRIRKSSIRAEGITADTYDSEAE